MTVIRLRDQVPEVYVNESRDFQLFCTIFETVYNGLKYDIDSIINVLDTNLCKNNLLPLLKLKLGFFTKNEYSEDILRKILIAFIPIVKEKGTLKGIKDIAELYLKLNGLETEVKVDIINETPTDTQKYLYGNIESHTIVLGVNSNVKDPNILYELLKYVSPIGYKFVYYFYSKSSSRTEIKDKQKAHILYISNDINSPITGSFPPTVAFTGTGIHKNHYTFTKNPDAGATDYDEYTGTGMRGYSKISGTTTVPDLYYRDTIASINNIEVTPISEQEMTALEIPDVYARPVVRDGQNEPISSAQKTAVDKRNTLVEKEVPSGV